MFSSNKILARPKQKDKKITLKKGCASNEMKARIKFCEFRYLTVFELSMTSQFLQQTQLAVRFFFN